MGRTGDRRDIHCNRTHAYTTHRILGTDLSTTGGDVGLVDSFLSSGRYPPVPSLDMSRQSAWFALLDYLFLATKSKMLEKGLLDRDFFRYSRLGCLVFSLGLFVRLFLIGMCFLFSLSVMGYYEDTRLSRTRRDGLQKDRRRMAKPSRNSGWERVGLVLLICDFTTPILPVA